MNAMTHQQMLDEFARAAQLQSDTIEAMIEEIRCLSSFEGKLLIDLEGIDEAFGAMNPPVPACGGHVDSSFAIRA